MHNADKGDYPWQKENASENHIFEKRSILLFHGKKPPSRGAL